MALEDSACMSMCILCVQLFVCVYMYIQVCSCIWKPEVNVRFSPAVAVHLMCRQGLPLNIKLTDLVRFAGIELPESFCLYPTSPSCF